MIWTWLTFGLLVLILSAVAWKPIVAGIKGREDKIKGDLDRAEKSQRDAEALRLKYETQLAEAQRTIQAMVTKAKLDGERARAELLFVAKEESEKILEKGKRDLAGETDKLKLELRGEVAGLSLLIAEKILNRSVDKNLQDEVLKESLASLAGVKK